MEFLNEQQKKNELAKSMIQNGLAVNLQDALNKIESNWDARDPMVESASVEQPVGEVEQPVEQPVEPQVEINEVRDAGEVSSSVGDYNQRLGKIEDFLKRFDKFFSKVYEDNLKKFEDIQAGLREVKSEIESLKTCEKKVEQAQQVLQKPEPKEEKKDAPPRSGKYNPNDVSVEKIFNNSDNQMMKR